MQTFKQLILVYGTLKKNKSNHRFLSNAIFLDNFITPAKYTLYDGGFPVVEREGNTSIHCELYEVNDVETVKRLHSLEGFTGIQYHKDNWYDIDIIETPYGEAIMYVQNKNQSGRAKTIESGVWQ